MFSDDKSIPWEKENIKLIAPMVKLLLKAVSFMVQQKYAEYFRQLLH